MDFYSFVHRTYPLRRLIQWIIRIVLFFQRKKIILVFGLSRSGTTMLGKFLALGHRSVYMHEPEKELLLRKYRKEQTEAFDYKTFTLFVFDETRREFKLHALLCTILQAALWTHRSAKTISIKPIYLIDVMGEASRALPDAKLLYISRHPCGRSESILRQRQHDQKIDPASTQESYLEMLGRAWGEGIASAQVSFKQHPEWHWVLFEKLSKQPLVEFKELYSRLDLPWDEQVQKRIQEMTTGEDGGFYETQRNSAAQAEKWREALSAAQVDAIRKGCAPFQTDLYESF